MKNPDVTEQEKAPTPVACSDWLDLIVGLITISGSGGGAGFCCINEWRIATLCFAASNAAQAARYIITRMRSNDKIQP